MREKLYIGQLFREKVWTQKIVYRVAVSCRIFAFT